MKSYLTAAILLACAFVGRVVAAPTVVVYNQTQSTVDGQPFLPKGIYGVNPADFTRAASYGYNIVQSYQLSGMADSQVTSYLDQAQQKGLKVLFHLGATQATTAQVNAAKSRVTLFKNHPAMYAWYLADEPNTANTDHTALKALYDWIKTNDPNHPVFSSNWELGTFKDCCDVDMPQLYSGSPSRQRTGALPGRLPQSVQDGEAWIAIANSYEGFVSSAESLSPDTILAKNPDGTYKSGLTQAQTDAKIQAIRNNLANPPYADPPALPNTPAEVRGQAFDMLAHGSNGLFYWLLQPEDSINTTWGWYTIYPRQSLRDAMTAAMHELDTLWPRISCPAQNATTWYEESGDVFVWYRRQGSQITIIAVNESENVRSVNTPVPSLSNQASIAATVSSESRSVTLLNGFLADTFQPNEAHVYLIDGAGPDTEADGVWTNQAGGSWKTSGNWSNGTFANGVGKTADFSKLNLTANAAVTLDGSPVVGILKFADATTANHDWFLNAGTGGPLTIAGGGVIDVANRTASISAVVAGQGFTKKGSGALTLSGANTYKGGTTVEAGSVNVSGNQSVADGGWTLSKTATVNVQNGATVVVANGKAVSLSNDAWPNTHNLNVAGTVINAGTFSMGGASNLTINSGGNWTQSGAVNLAPNWSYENARITVNSGGTFTYTGASTIALKSSNATSGVTDKSIVTIAGGTFITGQGFHNSIVGGAGSASVEFSSGGVLKLTSDIATLATTADRPFNVQIGTGGGKIDTNGYSTFITQGIANISGQTGALTKRGEGTLTLAGSNSYTGATMIEAGTLNVTGMLGNTAVEVKSAAKLAAGGNFGGPVTVRSNGRLAFAVATSPAAQTARTMSGALTFDSGSVLDLSAATTPAVGTYVLATAASISGTPGTVNLPAGMNGSVDVVGNSLRLTVTESYSTWIATYNVGGKTAANDDADMDGLANAVEYVLGTTPNVPNAATLQSQKSGSNFVFTFPRADGSEQGSLQLTVEAGSTLQSWNQVYQVGATTAASTAGVVVTENGTAPDTVTVTIPATGAPAYFARLKVVAQ